MKLLDRYLLGQFFKNLLLILSSLVAIYLLIDFFERMDNFMDAHKPIGLAIKYFLCKIPQIYDMMIPICMLLAGVTTLGMLNRQHEFVALKAAGISVSRIIAPLLIGASIVTTINIGIDQWLLPPTNSAVNRIFFEEVQNRVPTGVVRNGRVYHRGPDGIYSFMRPNPHKNHFLDFSYVTWNESHQMEMLLTAQTADWQEGQWTFQNGQLKKRTPGNDFAITLFKKTDIPLPGTPDTFFVSPYIAEEYSILDLYHRAQDQVEYGDRTGWIDFHRRLSFIFLGLPLLLLGIPVLLVVQERRGRDLALAIPISCGLAFGAWGWWSLAQSLAKTVNIPPSILAWSIHLLAASVGIYFIRRQDQ